MVLYQVCLSQSSLQARDLGRDAVYHSLPAKFVADAHCRVGRHESSCAHSATVFLDPFQLEDSFLCQLVAMVKITQENLGGSVNEWDHVVPKRFHLHSHKRLRRRRQCLPGDCAASDTHILMLYDLTGRLGSKI